MTSLRVDPSVLESLRSPGSVVEMLDPTGAPVGYFVPCHPSDASKRCPPKIDDAEIQRRIAAGGGRTLDEIVADWMH